MINKVLDDLKAIVTPDSVDTLFLAILGRSAEAAAVEHNVNSGRTVGELRRLLLMCREFGNRYAALRPTADGPSGPRIDWVSAGLRDPDVVVLAGALAATSMDAPVVTREAVAAVIPMLAGIFARLSATRQVELVCRQPALERIERLMSQLHNVHPMGTSGHSDRNGAVCRVAVVSLDSRSLVWSEAGMALQNSIAEAPDVLIVLISDRELAKSETSYASQEGFAAEAVAGRWAVLRDASADDLAGFMLGAGQGRKMVSVDIPARELSEGRARVRLVILANPGIAETVLGTA